MGPAVEDHPEEMRRTLLCELTGVLEGTSGGGRAGAHLELADDHERADLRSRLVHLAGELQRLLGKLHCVPSVALHGDLYFGRFDRRQSAVALDLGGDPRRAPQAVAGALLAPVV